MLAGSERFGLFLSQENLEYGWAPMALEIQASAAEVAVLKAHVGHRVFVGGTFKARQSQVPDSSATLGVLSNLTLVGRTGRNYPVKEVSC